MTIDINNISNNHKVALSLAMKGVRVFPCHAEDGPPGDDGKPLWKAKQPMPRLKWKEGASCDLDMINAWWQAAPAALVGMPLDQTEMVVLDPDRHPGGPDGIAAFDQLAARIPGLAGGPYVQTPQGRHYIYQQPKPPLGNAQGALPPGINVRGVGGYVIAPGTVRPDGLGWVIHSNGDMPPVLPIAVIDMIRGKPFQEDDPESFRQANILDDITYPDDPRLAAYLRATCNNAFEKVAGAEIGNRNNMLNTQALKLGHFVPHLLDEAEIIAFLTEAAIVAGLDTIEIGPSIRSGLSKGKSQPRQPFEDIAEEFWDGDIPEDKPAPRRIHRASVAWDIPRPEYLIDNLILQRGVGLLIGDTQTYKSFIALSMALAITNNLDKWEGHAIKAPANAVVLYISGEGGDAGIAQRIRAWAHDHGYSKETFSDRFTFLTAPINLTDKANTLALVTEIKAEIGDNPLAFIVLDTVNTSAPGIEENSTKETGQLYAICRSIERTFNCFVLGAHHTNKQGTMRGANLLRQNADALLFMKRADPLTGNVEMVIQKLKDSACGHSLHFHLDIVTMPDSSTSLVPHSIGAIQAQRTETTARGRPSSKTDAVLDILRSSQHIDGETSAQIHNIMDITEKKEKNNIDRLLRRLAEKGLINRARNGRWTIVVNDDFLD
jgi:hypothetical protein